MDKEYLKSILPTTIGLRICSVFYFFIGLIALAFPFIVWLLIEFNIAEPYDIFDGVYTMGEAIGISLIFALILAVFSIGPAILIEVSIFFLRRKKFWAWVLCICWCGMFLPSIFLPFAGLALYGLVNQKTRSYFFAKQPSES